MKLPIIILMFILTCGNVEAQSKFQFSSQNYAGITEGEWGTSFQIQTINGIRNKKWFTGIGAGIDYYYLRSVPVFLSVSRFLNTPKVPLYFTGDLGINFPWTSNRYYFEYPGEYHASLYGAAGVGYKFGFKKSDNALLLNLGYSYKRLTQTYQGGTICLIPPCPVSTEKYDYMLRRLSVRIGFSF